jgi:hypothetical protein
MCQCAVWEWAPWRPFSRNPLLAGTQRLRLSERLRLR